MRVPIVLVCGVAAALALSGCSNVKSALGLEKQVPDEFDVVANAPLAIPPDFNLRPPRPGAAPTQGLTPTAQAKQAIFRAAGDNSGGASGDAQMSAGENDIVRAAGADATPGDIRQVVNQEDSAAHPISKGFVDEIMFWRSDKHANRGVLDPVKETARLEEQSSARTVATQFAAPPTIERKSEGGSFLDRLF
jgi:hypothetical protein